MPSADRRLAKQTAAALKAAAPHLSAVDRARVAALARRGEKQIVEEIRAALDYLNDELSAQTVTRLTVLTGKGTSEIREYRGDPDYTARHRAAVELLSVYGMYPSKNIGGNTSMAGAKIEITLRAANEPDTVTVVEVPAKPA